MSGPLLMQQAAGHQKAPLQLLLFDAADPANLGQNIHLRYGEVGVLQGQHSVPEMPTQQSTHEMRYSQLAP